MSKYVEILCPICNKIGKKKLDEFNRNKRLNRVNYCSRVCGGKNVGDYKVEKSRKCSTCSKNYIPSSNHLNCPSCRNELSKKLCPNCGIVKIQKSSNFCKNCSSGQRLKGVQKKERDDKFYISEILRRVKLRCREKSKMSFNITIDYLIDLWYKQNKRCCYTNIELTLPLYNRNNNKITTASLDRIDSSKGYIKGNVQFLSTAINYMKNDMSNEDTIKLINMIKNNGAEY